MKNYRSALFLGMLLTSFYVQAARPLVGLQVSSNFTKLIVICADAVASDKCQTFNIYNDHLKLNKNVLNEESLGKLDDIINRGRKGLREKNEGAFMEQGGFPIVKEIRLGNENFAPKSKTFTEDCFKYYADNTPIDTRLSTGGLLLDYASLPVKFVAAGIGDVLTYTVVPTLEAVAYPGKLLARKISSDGQKNLLQQMFDHSMKGQVKKVSFDKARRLELTIVEGLKQLESELQ
ncbi:MAG: hypothetical protein H0V66_04060 [Bdellovibrionales bacterium]|nr:hypothetical protein [Bdellovibrionales bacterium]